MSIDALAFDLFGWVGLIQIENIQIAFAKEIKNGFEVKEKENLKIKEFKKL